MNTNETIQAEIKRLADYLSGLEKDGKPLFSAARIPCKLCKKTGSLRDLNYPGSKTTCWDCEGRGYIASLSREDWEQAADRYKPWSLVCYTSGNCYFTLAPDKIYSAFATDKFLAMLRALEKLAKEGR